MPSLSVGCFALEVTRGNRQIPAAWPHWFPGCLGLTLVNDLFSKALLSFSYPRMNYSRVHVLNLSYFLHWNRGVQWTSTLDFAACAFFFNIILVKTKVSGLPLTYSPTTEGEKMLLHSSPYFSFLQLASQLTCHTEGRFQEK